MKKMYKNFNKTAIISVCIAILSIVVGLGVNIALAAWTAPSNVPPLGDIAAPINVSNSDQYKLGGLRLGSANSPGAYQLYVEGDTFSEGSILPGSAGTYTLGQTGSRWSELWIDADPNGGVLTEGIHFDDPNTGIRYDTSNDRFDFYKNAVIASIGGDGNIVTTGDVTAAGGMNIDSNTLVVDSTNDRVGIGTGTPDYELHLKAGDTVIEDGRLMIGGAVFPSGAGSHTSTLHVGLPASPTGTDSSIVAYGAGAESTIYGYNSGSSWRAGVQGHGTGTYGVRGSTDSGTRGGVVGFNLSHRTSTSDNPSGSDFAGATKGKGCVTASCAGFGSGPYGTSESRPARSTGVLGEGANTNLSNGYIETYGVAAMAGNASADSVSESIKTFGLYAFEGLEEFGGVSYAGYFEGDVVIASGINGEGDLTVGSAFFVDTSSERIGIRNSAPSYTLDVATSSQEGMRLFRDGGSTYLSLQGYDIGTKYRDNSGTVLWTVGKDNSDNYFKIEAGAGDLGNSSTLVINSTGNINIGTDISNTTDKLRVKGNVRVDNETADPAYLQIDSRLGAPIDGDCDDVSEVGRMVLDSVNDELYVCDGSGWMSTTLI